MSAREPGGGGRGGGRLHSNGAGGNERDGGGQGGSDEGGNDEVRSGRGGGVQCGDGRGGGGQGGSGQGDGDVAGSGRGGGGHGGGGAVVTGHSGGAEKEGAQATGGHGRGEQDGGRQPAKSNGRGGTREGAGRPSGLQRAARARGQTRLLFSRRDRDVEAVAGDEQSAPTLRPSSGGGRQEGSLAGLTSSPTRAPSHEGSLDAGVAQSAGASVLGKRPAHARVGAVRRASLGPPTVGPCRPSSTGTAASLASTAAAARPPSRLDATHPPSSNVAASAAGRNEAGVFVAEITPAHALTSAGTGTSSGPTNSAERRLSGGGSVARVDAGGSVEPDRGQGRIEEQWRGLERVVGVPCEDEGELPRKDGAALGAGREDGDGWADPEDELEPEDEVLGGDAAGGAEDGSTSEPPTTPRRHARPAGATLTYLNKIRHKLANDPAFFQSLHGNIIYPPHPLMSSSSENPSAFYLPKVLVFAPHASKRSGDTKCCPRCGGNKVYGDGWSQFRRIIDVNDCFFVIGQRYRCQARHPNNTFVAWDERLLRAAPPHILALLPVILTRKLGVSQALMDLMRSLVDSGMGMGPFAEMIKENHTREHHRRELAYLSRLERLRPDPSTGQRTMSACRSPPPHFSLFSTQDGYNGCYGSLGYFRSVYVREMAKLEPRLKRHSAALPARVLSGDHFFKIIKCNFTFKGKRLFMAAYSLVNENTEVMAAVLTQSKSMDELRVLLEGVQRRLIAIGMPPAQVEVFYTDNPTAEAPFLESVYPGLSKSAVPLAGLGGRSSEAVLASRPELDFPADHYMEYVVNRDAAALAIDVFRRDLLDDARQRAVPPVMGLDVEWDISPGSSRRLQMLQLSSRTQTLVLHLSRMASIPHQLGALLVDPGVGKAGKMIAGDAAKLDAEWSLPVRGWFELGMYAKERKLIPNAGISLAALTEVLLDRTLNKSEQLRFGNWSAPLSNDAQRYAGLDAYASLAVYEAARTMCSATPGPNATVEGMRVFLTDACGLRRVAICSVVRDSTNVAVDAVKVRLEKVLLPGYVVPKIGLQPSRALRDIATDGASKGTKQVFAVSRRHLRDVAHPVEKRRTEDLRRGRLVRAALE